MTYDLKQKMGLPQYESEGTPDMYRVALTS